MQFWINSRGETDREIPESRLEFLEKFSANNFALSDGEDNTSRPLSREGIADLPLRRTLLLIRQKSQEPSFGEVLDSSWTLLQRLLVCLHFTLDSDSLDDKKWFLWTVAATQAAENYGDEWGLTWYFRWGTYTPVPTWTHSQSAPAAAEALSLKISHRTSLKWSQRLSQSAWEYS